MMRKMVCPQCKVGAFFVMNGQGERLPVYISDKGEIVPKDGTSSLEGYDQDTVYCLCCSWIASRYLEKSSSSCQAFMDKIL